MSELYHMSDAVEITECEGTGRMVSLVGSQLTTSPAEDEVRTLSICALSNCEIVCMSMDFTDYYVIFIWKTPLKSYLCRYVV